MALSGKRVAVVNIKSDGDVFYELWKAHQPQIPNFTPTTLQNVQIVEGEVGTVSVVIFWNYFHNGKDSAARTVITDIDDDKKSVTYKILDGDLLQLYKTFVVNVRVENDGVNNVVTWTVEYEKLSPNVPDPDTLMDLCTLATKDIETRMLQS